MITFPCIFPHPPIESKEDREVADVIGRADKVILFPLFLLDKLSGSKVMDW